MLSFKKAKSLNKYEITPIKGSRFIAFVFPVGDRKDCQKKVATIRKKYPDATHVCHAVRTETKIKTDIFGNQLLEAEFEYTDDDGEPNYSAGKPILRVLQGSELCDTACVVVRYFAGTKLGIGGLIKAYALAAKSVIEKTKIVDHIPLSKKCGKCAIAELPSLISYCEQNSHDYEYAIDGEVVAFSLQLPKYAYHDIQKKLSSSITSLIWS